MFSMNKHINRALCGSLLAAGLFELLCGHARFVISGCQQVPSDAVIPSMFGIGMIAFALAIWED